MWSCFIVGRGPHGLVVMCSSVELNDEDSRAGNGDTFPIYVTHWLYNLGQIT